MQEPQKTFFPFDAPWLVWFIPPACEGAASVPGRGGRGALLQGLQGGFWVMGEGRVPAAAGCRDTRRPGSRSLGKDGPNVSPRALPTEKCPLLPTPSVGTCRPASSRPGDGQHPTGVGGGGAAGAARGPGEAMPGPVRPGRGLRVAAGPDGASRRPERGAGGRPGEPGGEGGPGGPAARVLPARCPCAARAARGA